MTATDRPGRAVAVVGHASKKSLLLWYEVVIHELTGLPVRVLPVTRDGVPDLSADIGAVVLAHTLPERAHSPQTFLDGLPVLTDQDATAIALAAMLLTTLARAGRAPQSSRVVIAGADTMPILCPLVMTTGVGDVTTWNPAAAPTVPLRHVTVGVDAVIDLLGGVEAPAGTAVIAPDSQRDPMLALPGLLRAVTQRRDAGLDVDIYYACALALVMATPPDQQLPQRRDPALLADRVAEAAIQAYDARFSRPS